MKEQEIICMSSFCFVLQKQIEVVAVSKWYLFVFQITWNIFFIIIFPFMSLELSFKNKEIYEITSVYMMCWIFMKQT